MDKYIVANWKMNKDFSDIAVFPLEEYTAEQFMIHGSNVLYGATEYSVLNDIIKKCMPQGFLKSSMR